MSSSPSSSIGAEPAPPPTVLPTRESPRFMRRKLAGAYLLKKYGVGSPRTLAKLAVIGGGPLFSKLGRAVVYRPEDLDEWAMSRISPPRRSTSDGGGA